MSELHKAAGKEDLQLLRELLELDADINARDGIGRASLHVAAIGGHLEVAYFLLKSGADLSL
ncbi:MAG: ankyrin repeat domain-containing protein [Thermofilaceae archaeon]